MLTIRHHGTEYFRAKRLAASRPVIARATLRPCNPLASNLGVDPETKALPTTTRHTCHRAASLPLTRPDALKPGKVDTLDKIETT
ncbi:hypothetical protein [Nocardioides sp. NPDC127503]|uniref:hypothetical protein n=1 Tax=Nocardioides sp. NPDC127503 TaxID=3154516 RepID=UPI00331CDDFF